MKDIRRIKGISACGKEFTKEYMKEKGTLTLRCTNNEFIAVLCKECEKKRKPIKENRGSKRFCCFCNKQITRNQNFIKIKEVKKKDMGEKTLFNLHRKCYNDWDIKWEKLVK